MIDVSKADEAVVLKLHETFFNRQRFESVQARNCRQNSGRDFWIDAQVGIDEIRENTLIFFASLQHVQRNPAFLLRADFLHLSPIGLAFKDLHLRLR
ncbi:hypothetical protein D3C72_2101080 [compost metagenome]